MSARLVRCVSAAAWLLGVSASPAADPLTAAARQHVVRAAATSLREEYIFPETGDRAASALETKLADGGYQRASSPRAFAQELTDDLQATTHDKHLRVFPARQPFLAPNGSPPPQNQGGIVTADRLLGGIGYLEISAFLPAILSREPTDRAMAALADTTALIIDLRRNGGGDPSSVAHLVSFFVPNQPSINVNDFVKRTPKTHTFTILKFYTRPTTTKYLHRKVVILTSGQTFSGAEEFAYDMQNLDLATIVGEPTGGGANPGGRVDLGPDFAMFLPGGRAFNPITRTNWEGKGVQPAVTVPSADALLKALALLRAPQPGTTLSDIKHQALFSPSHEQAPGSADALRRLVNQLEAGNLADSNVSNDLRKRLMSNLASVRQSLRPFGPAQHVRFIEKDPFGGDNFQVVLEHGSFKAGIIMGSGGRIVDLDLPGFH